MKKILYNLIVIFGGIFFTSSNLFAFPDRCGGDGPTPFYEGIELDVDEVVLPGNSNTIRDYVYSEKRNSILYRDQKTDLYEYSLATRKLDYLTQAANALSHLADPKGQLLIFEKSPLVFHIPARVWESGYNISPDQENLFWHEDHSYSIRLKEQTAYGYDYVIQRFHRNNLVSEPVCKISGADSLNLARGNQFPYVYLYSYLPTYSGKYILRYSKVNVTNCNIMSYQFQGTYPVPIEGMYQFPGAKAFAIKLENASGHLPHSLEFWTEDSCAAFDIGDEDPLFITPDRPLIGTWNLVDGFVIRDLENQTVSNPILDIKAVKESDIWLTKRNELFLAVTPQDTQSKSIIKVKFK